MGSEMMTEFPPAPKKCPKCGFEMTDSRHLQALGATVELVTDTGFLGDKITAYFCEKCDYVELHRVKTPG